MDLDNLLNDSESSIELSLSCSSSPFGSCDEASDLMETRQESQQTADTILPYQFEPYDSGEENVSDGNDSDCEDRLQNSDWCTCGHCQVMPSARECVCCCEIERVVQVKERESGVTCITNHPGFDFVCLNIHVLEVAYLQYRQQYGERPEQHNERHRYTAYRQFTRWCWHYLGKDVRVVLPACVVRKIRIAFPDPSQTYKGFHAAESH